VTLDRMNRLPETEAHAALARCCGATRWVHAMVAARPFPDVAALHAAAGRAADALVRQDWLESFSHHPRIGEIGALRAKFAGTAAWAGAEQAGAATASEHTLRALAEGNRAYEARFGYIFVVCATGLSADEMLAQLRARLDHDSDTEFAVAVGEQRKITRLRLEKLLAGD
jgi:2-oxo-4-hydroxy-4-carboxy-5-ureidoimidazoline decarboxylase